MPTSKTSFVKEPLFETLSPESNYSNEVSIEHKKQFAQFFTPEPIAALMGDWLLGNPNLSTVLEPAIGLGVFSRYLFGKKEGLKVTGFDLDESILSEARKVLREENNIRLINKDYLSAQFPETFDGIVCNPPYFKFHDYDNKPILNDFARFYGFDLSGFTNIYTLFLLKSVKELNTSGRAAYIIPSEFLNSDYGRRVKHYLLESNTLRHICIVDFNENVFDDALTTASIILLANDKHDEYVNFSKVNSVKDLKILSKFISEYPSLSSESHVAKLDMDPDIKWRAYYEPQEANRYSNLVPVSKYAKVVRGIATGANNYFVLNKSKAKENRLNSKLLLPCITRSSDVTGSFFTTQHVDNLVAQNKKVFLFDSVGREDDQFASAYIEKGVDLAIDKKYLPASRKPWYSLENRPPSPIWVGVFSRSGVRFVRNEAGIRNLTTFHSVYIKEEFQHLTDLIFAYFLTEPARQILSDNRREYGNGLQKFEPNDLNTSKMLDVELIPREKAERIGRLLATYRNSESPDAEILTKIGDIFVRCLSPNTVKGRNRRQGSARSRSKERDNSFVLRNERRGVLDPKP